MTSQLTKNHSDGPEILAKLPRRICDVLEPWVERLPDHPALVEASGTWTYAELAAMADKTKDLLRDEGIRPGDRVMILCENCRTSVAMLLAVTKLNAWPVLVNAKLSPQEVDQIRDHAGARRVLYTVAASPHAMKHANRHAAEIRDAVGLGRIGIGPLE